MIVGCLLSVVRYQQLLQTISHPKKWLEFNQIWLTGMVLIWPSQIIDGIVYLDHMGKNRFSKTLKIFLSETTRLIALIFCVGLSSKFFFCSNYAHGATNCPTSGFTCFTQAVGWSAECDCGIS